MALNPGARLGRYEIRSKLGEGGMGEVYLAEDTRLHRKIALKILPGNLAGNPDRMRRFEQEATEPRRKQAGRAGQKQGFQFYHFGWTPDGKQLIISYGPQTDDVVLLQDFK